LDAQSIKLRLGRFAMRERPDIIEMAKIASGRKEALWLVGGVVRDAALDRVLNDVDIAVDGDAAALAAQIAVSLDATYVPLHDDPPTARVVKDGFEYDLVALRAPTIKEDLLLRDLRINAMAASLTPQGVGDVLDPADALSDIENRVIRAISLDNLQSDPLRTLRVFRFMAQTDFKIDAQTFDWAKKAAAGLKSVAGERIFAEFIKLLRAPHAAKVLRLAQQQDILSKIITRQIGSSSESAECPLDGVSFATVEAFDTQSDLWRKLFDDFDGFSAMMKNDRLCGDPAIMKTVALFGEIPNGLKTLEASCERWKAPRRFCGAVAKILELQNSLAIHLNNFSAGGDKMRIFARYTQEAGDAWLAAALYALVAAGDLANDYAAFFHDLLKAHREIIGVVDGGPPLVDGSQLIGELQIEAGPTVGLLLAKIRTERIAGVVNTPDEALELCRRVLAQSPSSTPILGR
jgi:poly(A) polymerase